MIGQAKAVLFYSRRGRDAEEGDRRGVGNLGWGKSGCQASLESQELLFEV